MNAIAPKGACPGLFAPMASGDGLLVRLRPPRGGLPATAARRLGAAASRFGNGMIELTQRAAIQVRGLRPDTLEAFAAAMVREGLADSDPEVERRRRVVRPPLGDSGPAAAVADAVEALLARDPRLAGLPQKFCVAVDGGALPLGEIGADIRVACDGPDCRVAASGAPDAVRCGADDAAAIVGALASAFLALARGPAQRRMRLLVAAIGPAALFAQAGLLADTALTPAAAAPAIGWTPEAGAFGFGMPFGACDAKLLAELAGLAEQFGDGLLRPAPWRAFVLAGVAARDAAALRARAAALGLIVEPDDPRTRVIACAGRPACASASVAARADARRNSALGLPGIVHVSGCSKGCAHPGAAAFTLVGDGGRYNLVRDGGAADAPSLSGLTIADAAAVLRGAA